MVTNVVRNGAEVLGVHTAWGIYAGVKSNGRAILSSARSARHAAPDLPVWHRSTTRRDPDSGPTSILPPAVTVAFIGALRRIWAALPPSSPRLDHLNTVLTNPRPAYAAQYLKTGAQASALSAQRSAVMASASAHIDFRHGYQGPSSDVRHKVRSGPVRDYRSRPTTQ
jgi:hypothetical protein